MNGTEIGWDWIFELLLLTVLIGTFIMLTNKSHEKQKKDPEDEDTYKILKTRYAKGEISKTEYNRLKKELQN